MTVYLYGFDDRVSNVSLLIRAESKEQAKLLLDDYVDILNSITVTELQIKKEIPQGTLRASGFEINGIINGGEKIDGVEDPNAPKALFINAVDNSYASTPSASGNTPSDPFTLIVNARSNDWFGSSDDQTLIAKADRGKEVFDGTFEFFVFLSPAGLLVVSMNVYSTAGDLEADAAFDLGTVDSNAVLWLRADFNTDFRIIQIFKSEQPPETRYQDIVWAEVGNKTFNTFSLSQGSDRVTVGAREISGSPSADGFNGIIYRTLLINSNDETAAPSMDMNPNDYNGGSSWNTPLTSEKWTLNGDAAIHSYSSETS